MTIIEQLTNILSDLKVQQRMGREVNWSEVSEISKRLTAVAKELDEFAWDKQNEVEA